MPTPPDPAQPHDAEKHAAEPTPARTLNQLARYSDLALVMPGGAIAGWFIGAMLDHAFSTHWIYLVGAIIGIVGAFVHIVRVALSGPRE